MIPAALVSLKLHRFGTAVAGFAALAIAVWGLTVKLRLGSLGTSRDCLDQWARGVAALGADCPTTFGSWSSLAGEATRIIGASAYLPFLVGLVAGTPLVARELEARTSETAWSLAASRIRWLLGRVLPIMAVIAVAITAAAMVTASVQADREAFGESAFFSLGNSGVPVVARAIGAFGIGLLVGAVVGRTLPSIVLGGLLILAVSAGVATAREGWLASFEPERPSESVGGESSGVVVTDIAWQTPDGAVLTREEARERATGAGVPPAQPDDVQDSPALEWYEQNGYSEIALGVPEQTAVGWGAYDALIWTAAGAVALAATAVIITRRRPA